MDTEIGVNFGKAKRRLVIREMCQGTLGTGAIKRLRPKLLGKL